jgi:pyruvate formate lyase activating enzyme
LQEDLLDYVAMDIKTDPFQYTPFVRGEYRPQNIVESIEIIMGSDLGYEFRTTCVKPIVTGDTIENIARIIRGARLYALQGFHETEMLHPEFFQDVDPRYDDDAMMGLKAAADPWVEECIVR